MDKPTLEEQLAVSKFSFEECINLLKGNPIEWIIYRKLNTIWHVIHWNWFNIYTEEESCWSYLKSMIRKTPH